MFWQRFSRVQARGILAALLVSLAGAGFSAHALGPAQIAAKPPAPAPRGYEADDHFPGAALVNPTEDDAPAPALSGATGTAPLPDGPVPADAVPDASVRAAPAFALAGSAADRTRALRCLTTAIYYEAANEPADGQRAVAQVVLNRVRHPAFPATVCGVVFQGSAKRGCQFSFACDGAMARAPSRAAWDRAQRIAADALAGAVFAPAGMATHYHTYAVTPGWNRSLVMTGAFGAHFFHRWKGWWGTPAAFTQRYRGGEPLPGPDAPAAAPEPKATSAAAQVRPAPATPATAREAIQPDHADTSTPRAPARDDPDSQVLDRWKDSGKPLR